MGQIDQQAYEYLQQRLHALGSSIEDLRRHDGILVLESFVLNTSILAGYSDGKERVAALHKLPCGPQRELFAANFMMQHRAQISKDSRSF